jgi:hypothetical protein
VPLESSGLTFKLLSKSGIPITIKIVAWTVEAKVMGLGVEEIRLYSVETDLVMPD